MDSLPNEILIYLCSSLPKRELKSLRLCSRLLAEAGQDELFRDFEFRLYPSSDRLGQLEQLSGHSLIASKLKCLSFESGILLEYADYRYWHAQVYKEINETWLQSKQGMMPKDEYTAFHTALHARFSDGMQQRYDLYRWHLDQEAAMVAKQCSYQQLLRVMKALARYCPSLVFKVAMIEPRISLEDVERFDPSLYNHEAEDRDPRRRVANRRQHTLDHFTNFLTAAHRSPIAVQELVAIDMPRSLLDGNTTFATETLQQLFANLVRLDLELSEFPWSDWLSRSGVEAVYVNGRIPAAQRLRRLLDYATHLQSLKLEFLYSKSAEYNYEFFDRTNINRFPRKFMSNIRDLELRNVECSLEDLQVFLEEAPQLRRLALVGGRLEAYSMVDLIQYVSSLKLEKITLMGSFIVDQDQGSWHAHSSEDFAHCVMSTTYEGPFAINGFRATIERYMLEGGPECPLPEWAPIDNTSCPWDLMGDSSWHFIKNET